MTTPDANWKERFRARVVLWTAPAPGNRRHAMAVSNRSGVAQLYAWDVASGELVQVTDRPTGTVHGRISADGEFVYFVDDSQGDEIGHWVAVPATGGAARDVTPTLPRYTSYDLTPSADGQLLCFTASTEHGQAVYLLDASAGSTAEPRLIHQTTAMCETIGFSSSGRLVGIRTSERASEARFSLLILEVATGERVAELWDGAESSIEDAQFSPAAGDNRVLAVSDLSGDRRPLLWDPLDDCREDIPVSGPGETFAFDWSADGRDVLLCRVRDAVQELTIYQVASGATRKLEHPAGVYGHYGELGNWFDHDGNIVAQWQDATHPATVILLDGHTGRFIRDLLPPSPVPPSRPWRSVTFIVDDQQPIQAWLATPAGDGPFPAVIDTHGGPESVAMEAFAPRAQGWVDAGFAYLTINYRGSITFGREFKESIWGSPGELEVRDIVAGRQWLIDNAIAVEGQVFLTGWSYGGFLTLQTLGRAPGLWAGGAAGIAVADWVSEYEDENDVMRSYDRALFGGTPEEKMDAYRAASPLTHAANVDAPVLIIQGRNDTRCPARQVELYEARMRELSKPIEVIWFDAGHAAGADVELAIQHHDAMLQFALRVLRSE